MQKMYSIIHPPKTSELFATTPCWWRPLSHPSKGHGGKHIDVQKDRPLLPLALRPSPAYTTLTSLDSLDLQTFILDDHVISSILILCHLPHIPLLHIVRVNFKQKAYSHHPHLNLVCRDVGIISEAFHAKTLCQFVNCSCHCTKAVECDLTIH